MATNLLDQRVGFSADGATLDYEAFDGAPAIEDADDASGLFLPALGVEVGRTVGAAASITRGLEEFSPMWAFGDYDADVLGVPRISGVTAVAAGFYKDLEGTVWLKGHVKNGTIGAVVFTLPVGYRPLEDKAFTAHAESSTSSVLGAIMVKATGDVVISLGANALVSLNDIHFKGEQ